MSDAVIPPDLAFLGDAFERITSGKLYKIKIKAQGNNEGGEGGGEKEESVVPFIINRAQRRWLKRVWTRNVILKARQLGFTTLICIIWLDHALFNANQYCGIIAQDRETAEFIFRDKILLAYDNLPEMLKEAFPFSKRSASEIEFAHNKSKIRCATSVRGGTLDRLHVSEYGKICARDPQKSNEIITGSFPSVPTNGWLVVESTAEGQQGDYYTMVQRALAHVASGKKLNKKEFRIQFFPWWEEEEYRLDDPSVVISRDDHEYFDEIEGEIGRPIDAQQRTWWITTRDDEFGGMDERMWQEYPSTPKEAFKVSTEGCYYSKQMSVARKQRRIGHVPHVEGVPVDTYWDIGAGDGTGVWLKQRIGAENRFVSYIEGWGEHYSHYIKRLQETGYIWGTHYLPHDADAKRQQGERVVSPREELEAMGLGGRWETVPRVDDLTHGIQLTRQAFSTCWFDAAGCKEGLAHLALYRKTWSRKLSMFTEVPDKAGGHSEAADALRQFAQSGGGAGSGTSDIDAESLRKHVNRNRRR